MEAPSLRYLLEAYFHLDFREVNGGVWETVDAFVRMDPKEAVNVPCEVNAVLTALTTEEEVAAFVDESGCEYLAQPEGGGYRGWLQGIGRRVEMRLANPEPAREERPPARPKFRVRSSGYRPPTFASTFPDLDTAERAIGEVLDNHLPDLERWLETGGLRLRVEDDLGWIVGRSMDASREACEVTGVRVVIERDASMPDNIRIHDGFPQPHPRKPAMHVPALDNLMGAYFHQDWYDEHGDEWATLQDFINGEPQLAHLLPAEISQVLDQLPGEADVDAFLKALGCCYTVLPGEPGYRAWLREIGRRVAAAIASQS